MAALYLTPPFHSGEVSIGIKQKRGFNVSKPQYFQPPLRKKFEIGWEFNVSRPSYIEPGVQYSGSIFHNGV